MLDNLMVYKDDVLDIAVKWLPNIALAIFTLIFGFWFVNRLINFLDKTLKRHGVEPTLRGFLESFSSVLLKLFVVLLAASFLGVKTASFIALFGAAGLAVGLALQGSLSNLAGGALILFFKPFKVGDYIVAQSKEGVVEKIMIFNTMIRNVRNELIVIPNGDLANGIIENLTDDSKRRLDIKLGVAYSADIDHVRQTLMQVISANEKIMQTPPPEVLVSGHADSAVEILVRVWVGIADYWDVNFYLWEQSKKAFDREGIEIPFPQQDVHVRQS